MAPFTRQPHNKPSNGVQSQMTIIIRKWVLWQNVSGYDGKAWLDAVIINRGKGGKCPGEGNWDLYPPDSRQHVSHINGRKAVREMSIPPVKTTVHNRERDVERQVNAYSNQMNLQNVQCAMLHWDELVY